MAAYVRLRRQSPITATLWMTMGVLLLSWIPFVNGVAAGFAGGFRAHRTRWAVQSAISATLISGLTLFIAFNVFQISSKYMLYGLGLFGWMAVTFVGLLFGALSGAYLHDPHYATERWGGGQVLLPSHHRSHEGPPITGATTSDLDETL